MLCDSGRRTTLPATSKDNSHIGIMTILYNNIGKDLSRVSMPVALNEPLSLLQRLSEELEYTDLLDIANHIDDPYERMVSLVYLYDLTIWCSETGEFSANLKLKNCVLPGLCGSVLYFWLCLGILEVSLQTL